MYNNEKTREAEEILERITKELQRQEKTQAQLIDYLQLPKGTYSGWKSGRSRNYCEHIGEISLFLGVSAEYLVTGRVQNTAIENYRERELLLKYRSLNEKGQDELISVVREMTNTYSAD